MIVVYQFFVINLENAKIRTLHLKIKNVHLQSKIFTGIEVCRLRFLLNRKNIDKSFSFKKKKKNKRGTMLGDLRKNALGILHVIPNQCFTYIYALILIKHFQTPICSLLITQFKRSLIRASL